MGPARCSWPYALEIALNAEAGVEAVGRRDCPDRNARNCRRTGSGEARAIAVRDAAIVEAVAQVGAFRTDIEVLHRRPDQARTSVGNVGVAQDVAEGELVEGGSGPRT